jgi:hypothetical protein
LGAWPSQPAAPARMKPVSSPTALRWFAALVGRSDLLHESVASLSPGAADRPSSGSSARRWTLPQLQQLRAVRGHDGRAPGAHVRGERRRARLARVRPSLQARRPRPAGRPGSPPTSRAWTGSFGSRRSAPQGATLGGDAVRAAPDGAIPRSSDSSPTIRFPGHPPHSVRVVRYRYEFTRRRGDGRAPEIGGAGRRWIFISSPVSLPPIPNEAIRPRPVHGACCGRRSWADPWRS